MAKAVALALLSMPLPALGHSPEVAPASAPLSATTRISNAAPVAVTDYVELKNAAQALNVLANDTDANNDALKIIEATARYGAVAFTADGLVAYAANPSKSRADEIIYVVSDGHGGLSQGKVIVSVS